MTSAPRRLGLCAADQGSAVWLLDLDSGECRPVPSDLDATYAFDGALVRRGWVAARVGYQVAAFADGDSRAPAYLPEAWGMYPAAEPELLLIRRYLGRSGLPGDKYQMIVTDGSGEVRRATELPWGVQDLARVAGEVDSGIVTWAGIAAWEGGVRDLPVSITGDPFTDPRPVAVLGGRVVVFEAPDHVETVNMMTGARERLELPEVKRLGRFAQRLSFDLAFDPQQRRLCITDGSPLDPLGTLIVSVDEPLRYLTRPVDVDVWRSRGVWLHDGRLLFDDSRRVPAGVSTYRLFDPATGSMSSAPYPALQDGDLTLRADVTGHFVWPESDGERPGSRGRTPS